MTDPSSSATTRPPAFPSPRFRGEVLKQIYRVWLFRKLAPVLILEVLIFSFILYNLGQAVFIQRVIENAINVFFVAPSSILPFFISAFVNTTFLTKVLLVGVVSSIALILRHATQGLLRLILVRQNFFSRVGQK